MKTVQCHTFLGGFREIPIEKLVIRPAVYGVIVHGTQALLVRANTTGKWMLPGGEIEQGETVEDALRREMREEAGIAIVIGAFMHFEMNFFYYDPLDLAWQGYLFYYHCTPLSFELSITRHDEEGVPAWVEISSLTEDDFVAPGATILALLRGSLPS